MSVDFDVVDALAGLAEDLRADANLVDRLHKGVEEMRKERDQLKADLDMVDSDLQLAVKRLTAEVARLTGNVRLSPDEHIAATSLYVERWCDGTNGPCAVSDSGGRHDHFRSARRIELQALLDEFYRRGAEAMREAAAQAVYADFTTGFLAPATVTRAARVIRALPLLEDKP